MEPPKSIKDATTDYINELDYIGQFIDNKCIIDDKNKIERSELYESYVQWCKSNAITINKRQDFYNSIEKKGYTTSKIRGTLHIKGISLLDNDRNDNYEFIDENAVKNLLNV